MTEELGQWIFRTKFLDPKNRGYAAPRAFRPGEVPRAMPVYQGRLREMMDRFDKWQDEMGTRHIKLWRIGGLLTMISSYRS